MSLGSNRSRMIIGCLIGLGFLYLAGRKVDFSLMWEAFTKVNYWFVLLAVPVIFFSHFLRALRWRYLMDPIKRVDVASLFSALLIGYMANILMPAHLGEFLRAYVLGKKRGVSASSTFATIVVERVIDVFALLLLHPKHDVTVHLNKTTVAIPREPLIVGRGDERQDGLIVQTEV